MLTHLQGHDRNIRLDLWRRATFAAPPILHLRLGYRRWLLCCLVDDVHCPLLHQPGIPRLGAEVWVHLGAFLLESLWVYFFLPEVKDRTLEEIDEMFEARLPARGFRKHVCIGHPITSVGTTATGEKNAEVFHDELKV